MQVGDFATDAAYFGKPEQFTGARNVSVITRTNPGSDLLGGTAAALAASAMVFNASDPTYAAQLRSLAVSLYKCARRMICCVAARARRCWKGTGAFRGCTGRPGFMMGLPPPVDQLIPLCVAALQACTSHGHPSAVPAPTCNPQPAALGLQTAEANTQLCLRSEGTASLGLYSANIDTVLYNSTSYFDDLAWGALWLHRLTGQATYLDQARGLGFMRVEGPECVGLGPCAVCCLQQGGGCASAACALLWLHRLRWQAVLDQMCVLGCEDLLECFWASCHPACCLQQLVAGHVQSAAAGCGSGPAAASVVPCRLHLGLLSAH